MPSPILFDLTCWWFACLDWFSAGTVTINDEAYLIGGFHIDTDTDTGQATIFVSPRVSEPCTNDILWWNDTSILILNQS